MHRLSFGTTVVSNDSTTIRNPNRSRPIEFRRHYHQRKNRPEWAVVRGTFDVRSKPERM